MRAGTPWQKTGRDKNIPASCLTYNCKIRLLPCKDEYSTQHHQAAFREADKTAPEIEKSHYEHHPYT
jgi:hypothetical protein